MRDDAALLANADLFKAMSVDALERLAVNTTTRAYARGDLIFLEGSPGDALCVVVAGMVKIYVTSTDGDEMVLVTLGPSSVFGELSIIDAGRRSASAAAVEPTTLLVLHRGALMRTLGDSPELVDGLMRSLGSMVRRLTGQTADLVFLDLHGRVAKLLLTLAEKSGGAEANGWTLDLQLTQTDLANMVGGSRQSVNQVLRAFADLGYVELAGRRIVIRKPELLRRRAGQPAPDSRRNLR